MTKYYKFENYFKNHFQREIYLYVLSFFVFAPVFAENSLSFYVIPPTIKANYESPLSMAKSLKGAKKTKIERQENGSHKGRVFTVGHTLIELTCEQTENRDFFHRWTAVTDKNEYEEDILLEFNMVGFGFPFIGTKGKIQTEDDIFKIFSEVIEKKSKMVDIHFLIEPEICARMIDYLSEFEKNEVYKKFGVTFDPLKGEGAGCTSYAVSFLRSQQLFPEEWQKEWTRSLLIPEELIGGMDTGREIDPKEISSIPQSHAWAKLDQPHRLLEFYDPQKIYDWAIHYARASSEELPPGFSNSGYWEEWYKKNYTSDIISIRLPLNK